MKDVSMKALKSKLAGHEDLRRQVARVWGLHVEGQAEPPALDRVLAHVQERFFARSVWEQLTKVERTCLFQVLDAAKNGIPYERLLKKLKIAPEEFEAVIAHLRDDWFLIDEGEVAKTSSASAASSQAFRVFFPYRECHESLFYTGMELFRSYSDRSHMSLDHLVSVSVWSNVELLAGLCHVATPKGIPVYHSGSIPSISHPAEIRKRISEAMKQQLSAFEVLLHLQPPTQQLFHWLCEQGGTVSMSEARRYLQCDESLFFEHVHALEQHCLAFDTLTGKVERLLFIPHDLLAAVAQDVAQHASDERTYAFFPLTVSPSVIRGGQPLLCYDLATIVGCVYQSILERTKDDKLPKQKSMKIRPLLQGLDRIRDTQENGYVDELFYLARHLEVLVCAPPYGEEKPRYQPGPKLSMWSTMSFAEQTRRFIAWWSQSAHWYDIYPDGKLVYPSAYPTVAARKVLLDHLKRCVPERWYSLNALLFAIWKQQPIQIRDFYGRRLEEVPSLQSQREKWMQSGEGRLYMAILSSTLYEAGIVSLGYASNDDAGLESFQLTSFGAFALNEGSQTPERREDLAVERDERVLIVQPSFEVLLLQQDVALLYQLLQWAEVNHVGPVSTFTLTQHALLHGLEKGNSIDAMLDTLARRGQKMLPQNVEYTLRDWTKQYREAHLSEVILIELSDERGQQDLYRALDGQRVEARMLTPTTFAVLLNGTSFVGLRKLLEKTGIVVRGQPAKSVRSYR